MKKSKTNGRGVYMSPESTTLTLMCIGSILVESSQTAIEVFNEGTYDGYENWN